MVDLIQLGEAEAAANTASPTKDFKAGVENEFRLIAGSEVRVAVEHVSGNDDLEVGHIAVHVNGLLEDFLEPLLDLGNGKVVVRRFEEDVIMGIVGAPVPAHSGCGLVHTLEKLFLLNLSIERPYIFSLLVEGFSETVQLLLLSNGIGLLVFFRVIPVFEQIAYFLLAVNQSLQLGCFTLCVDVKVHAAAMRPGGVSDWSVFLIPDHCQVLGHKLRVLQVQ